VRLKLTISYNGALFYGSQIQINTPDTVMGVLCKILQRVGIKSVPIASGRTDRGVHATAQVIHLDIEPSWGEQQKLLRVLDHHLPPSIQVRDIVEVDKDFHARYSAKVRCYRYIISNLKPTPFEYDFITFTRDTINLELLKDSAKLFEGVHNFAYLQKRSSSNTTRAISKARVYQHGGYTIIYFEASGYLRSQVRMMVALLLAINNHTITQNELQEQLECKKRHITTPAPPNGLYLCSVRY